MEDTFNPLENTQSHNWNKEREETLKKLYPDFGIVMKRKQLCDGKESEFYFVIETKGTNNINDKKALKESEVYKINCAMKHFATLGVEVQYKAPIKEYQIFKEDAVNYMSNKTGNKV